MKLLDPGVCLVGYSNIPAQGCPQQKRCCDLRVLKVNVSVSRSDCAWSFGLLICERFWDQGVLPDPKICKMCANVCSHPAASLNLGTKAVC